MSENLYQQLDKTFHEPNRMAILSCLSSSDEGITFPNLKKECNLTDGNLNRHLKVLENEGLVKITKKDRGVKGKTTAFITEKGREGFLNYLLNLENALKAATKAAKAEESFLNSDQAFNTH